MLTTESEYRNTLIILDSIKKNIVQMQMNMRKMRMNEDQIKRAIQPTLCFRDQLSEEIEEYEQRNQDL